MTPTVVAAPGNKWLLGNRGNLTLDLDAPTEASAAQIFLPSVPCMEDARPQGPASTALQSQTDLSLRVPHSPRSGSSSFSSCSATQLPNLSIVVSNEVSAQTCGPVSATIRIFSNLRVSNLMLTE